MDNLDRGHTGSVKALMWLIRFMGSQYLRHVPGITVATRREELRLLTPTAIALIYHAVPFLFARWMKRTGGY